MADFHTASDSVADLPKKKTGERKTSVYIVPKPTAYSMFSSKVTDQLVHLDSPQVSFVVGLLQQMFSECSNSVISSSLVQLFFLIRDKFASNPVIGHSPKFRFCVGWEGLLETLSTTEIDWNEPSVVQTVSEITAATTDLLAKLDIVAIVKGPKKTYVQQAHVDARKLQLLIDSSWRQAGKDGGRYLDFLFFLLQNQFEDKMPKKTKKAKVAAETTKPEAGAASGMDI